MNKLTELLRKFNQEQSEQGDLHRDSRVLLVDGMNMFIGAFSASPAMNQRGEHIGGLKGFLASLLACITRFRPTRCVIVFDGLDGSVNRRKKFSEYKAGRKGRIRLNRFAQLHGTEDQGEDFKIQILKLKKYLDCMPVTTITIDFVEADDVIGYIVCDEYKDTDTEIIIVSSDKDFFQLVNPRVKVYRTAQKKVYDDEAVAETYGIPAYNFLTFRAVTGDTSDNLPGVTGVGLKSLIKLIPEITTSAVSCDDVMRIAAEKVSSGTKLKAYHSIVGSTDKINLNLDLMQLSDVDIPATKKLSITRFMEDTVDKFDMLEFRRLVHADGLNTGIDMLDSKAILTLSLLNNYAETR